jgi:hypothetical protein
MLESGLQEARTKVVKIEDVKSDVFRAFIQYVYKGYLDADSTAHVEDLLSFADKYMINNLKVNSWIFY